MKLGGELRGTYVHVTRPGFHKVQFVGLSTYGHLRQNPSVLVVEEREETRIRASA